jgi:hypothetical protein
MSDPSVDSLGNNFPFRRSAIEEQPETLLGLGFSRFGTWDHLWGANRISVGHGSLLERHHRARSTLFSVRGACFQFIEIDRAGIGV